MEAGRIFENNGSSSWCSIAPWLNAVITKVQRDNDVLRQNGASQAAQARERLMSEILEAVEVYASSCVTVHEAAHITGLSEETVRRAARRGDISAIQQAERGKMRIPRHNLEKLPSARHKRNNDQSYNVEVDAQHLTLMKVVHHG